MMYPIVVVIDDPSLRYDISQLARAACEFHFNHGATVSALKRFVEENYGIPTHRQVYHCVSDSTAFKLSFGSDPFFRRCEDDDLCLRTALDSLRERGIMINVQYIIAVVRPPAGNDLDDSNDEDVELVREVDTVEARIAAGRSTAIVVGNEDSSSESDEEDGQPQRKRARRKKDEEGNQRVARADRSEREEAEQRQEEGLAQEDNGVGGEDEEANEAEEGRTENEGDDDEPAAEVEEEEDGEAAAADDAQAGVAAVDPHDARGQVPAPDRPVPSSPLRLWLRGLDVAGGHPNRFEAYAPAFEREFGSLRALAAAADDDGIGFRDIFPACDVRRLGDRAIIKFEVAKLPRPE